MVRYAPWLRSSMISSSLEMVARGRASVSYGYSRDYKSTQIEALLSHLLTSSSKASLTYHTHPRRNTAHVLRWTPYPTTLHSPSSLSLSTRTTQPTPPFSTNPETQSTPSVRSSTRKAFLRRACMVRMGRGSRIGDGEMRGWGRRC